MIAAFAGRAPRIHADAYVVDAAVVVGDVEIGAETSVWFHAVIRGDVERVRLGARSNVQDNATIHVTGGRWPTICTAASRAESPSSFKVDPLGAVLDRGAHSRPRARIAAPLCWMRLFGYSS